MTSTSAGRNDPCPCGSGEKYENCCLGKPQPRQAPAISPGPSVQQELALLVSLFNQQRYPEAESLARALTHSHPQSSVCWKMLGAILLQTGRFAEALAPMQMAVTLLPTDAGAYSNLGCIQMELGLTVEAEASCRRALQLNPALAGVHNNLGNILKRQGRLEEAEASYRRALAVSPDYADAHGNLGMVLREFGRLDEALAAFRQKLALQPGDAETLHHVASLSGDHTERAPDEYVIRVFDNYAAAFDSHLQQELQYDVPEKLVARIREHAASLPETWRVLDLGCGTGLAGAALAPHARELVGVDLSPKMLEKARARNVYRRLEQEELLTRMKREAAAAYDVIIATDVFIYVGRIDEIVSEAKRLLGPGGILAMSVESHAGEHGGADGSPLGYRLTVTGRYSHAPGYLRKLAAASELEMLEMSPCRIRVERGNPVDGHLVLMQNGGRQT